MDSTPSAFNTTFSVPPSQSTQIASGGFDGQLNALIINTLWIGALVPISIALVLTSAHLWKKPVFIFNACAIGCGIAFGVVNLINVVSVMLFVITFTSS